MLKPICHVRNLRSSALSGYVSEIDAIATGGHYLPPDNSGWYEANYAHDLCVTCANCGTVVTNPGQGVEFICSDCGQDEFYVVQTVAPPPRRPTYSPLNPSTEPSNPLPAPSDDDAGDSPVVSPWARWAARTLDFSISFLLAVFVLSIFLTLIGCDVDNISDVGAMVLGIPPGLVLDALCYHYFGQTIGKWLFAVKIRHQNGVRLTFSEYLKRNVWVLIKGLGLCIPIVTIVTEVIQYNRLRSGKPASYDDGRDIKIVRVHHDVARTVFGIIALVALFVFLAVCNAG